MSDRFDIAIIGAGIAGASLAAEVAAHASVLLIEAEEQPGYHATGRSAAFWSESYGGPLVQPLTTASGPFLARPPPEFFDRSFLHRRGAINIADEAGRAVLDEMRAEFSAGPVMLEWMDPAALRQAVPGLRDGWDYALAEPSCADIDVGALHAAYLKAAHRKDAVLITASRVTALTRQAGGWSIAAGNRRFSAGIIVNAAGAWVDEVAAMALMPQLGVLPYRRTIVQLRIVPPAPSDLPLIIDALGRFYFKPETEGRLWLSPHDETACSACDSAPEEYDIALAIDRLQSVVDWKVERVEHSWAGLRSFAPDRLPIYGFADERRDFFWCAGQGGFGIQTAPAAAKMAASLLLDRAPDPMVAGLDPDPYRAGRFIN